MTKLKGVNPHEAGPQHMDVSGAQEEMMDCYQFGTVPAPDKQQPHPQAVDVTQFGAIGDKPVARHELSAIARPVAADLRDRVSYSGPMSELLDKMADALDAQAAQIAAYERLDEEGYASLAVDLAAAEQRIADLEYANSDTSGEQQLKAFAKQNAALREALEYIASGEGAYGWQAHEYKQIARAALKKTSDDR